MNVNRDTLVAIFLLLVCGGLAWASLDIREPDYGQLSPAAWPRTVVAVLALLSLIYLVQSLRQGPDVRSADAPTNVTTFFAYWRNVIWVFVLFFSYLLAIPWVGMLVGGTVFVFLLLSALGGLRKSALHAIIALVSVGGMWLVFTHGLNVRLPRGEWTGF